MSYANHVCKENSRNNETGKPYKREIEYCNVWLVEGKLLKRKRCRENGMYHDVEQQSQADEIPKQYQLSADLFPDKPVIEDQRRGDP